MLAVPVLVTSEMVARYTGMVEAHARRYARLPGMQSDQDDLIQEGLISVWNALQAGEPPSNKAVTNRMKNWVRTRTRQLANESAHDEEATG